MSGDLLAELKHRCRITLVCVHVFTHYQGEKKEQEKSACLLIHHCDIVLKMICCAIVFKLSNSLITETSIICISQADFHEECCLF